MRLLSALQGGCSEPNDGCTDTAQEAQPQFGCPVPAPNTCPGKPTAQPLLDPIHNFMVSMLSLLACNTHSRRSSINVCDAVVGSITTSRMPAGMVKLRITC